jgi:hypothetical protein
MTPNRKQPKSTLAVASVKNCTLINAAFLMNAALIKTSGIASFAGQFCNIRR